MPRLTLLLLLALVAAPLYADTPTQNKKLLDVSLTVDLSQDTGQNLGSLFEVYDADGNVLAGAGFLGAYNTESRADRYRLHFFLKQADPQHESQTLPRVNDQTGVYLSDQGPNLYARARSGLDDRFFRWDAKQQKWQHDPARTHYDTLVAGRPLVVDQHQVTYDGQKVLDVSGAASPVALRENYYALGRLVIRHQRSADGPESNQLVAYRWSPDQHPAPVDPATAVAITLRSHGEFVYALGQLDDHILAATNTGGVYVFKQDAWHVLVEPAAHSYQVYAMLNYYDRLLLGHYPTGEIYEYDGQTLRHLPGWPPVLPGVSDRAREAQTLAIYGGDLYAGVWPWGELWRYDRNQSAWQLVRRMFPHPDITDATVHPYENETTAVHPVLNLWGQRVTSIVPFETGLFVSTSSKGGAPFQSKFAFLSDDSLPPDRQPWLDYGRVYRLSLPDQLSAPLPYANKPTTLRFLVDENQITMLAEGKPLAKRARNQTADRSPTALIDVHPPTKITWARGTYGPLRADLLARDSHLDQPFLGTYLNFGQLFASAESDAARREEIDAALKTMSAAGITTVMPYVTTTSGAAAYPSANIDRRIYGDFDPLAHVIESARKQNLSVYPVFCVLASGHETPAGILEKHPDWALRTPDGQPMGHISPAHPDARAWVASVISEVADHYSVDGILLDYLRYYNRPTRLDAAAEHRLHQRIAAHPDQPADALEQRFREAELTKLARQISRAARHANPNLKIAIYSWGPHVAADHRVAQPWPRWSAAGLIDQVNISGYCYPDNYGDDYLDVYQKRLADAVALNARHHGRADVTVCVGIHTSHGSIQAASWIGDYLARATQAHASGAAFFTYNRLEPFLDETIRAAYIPDFAAGLTKQLADPHE